MARSLFTTLAILLAAGAAPPAAAATLLASSVLTLESDQFAQCHATNASDKKPIDVRMELFDQDGTVVHTATITLDPLNTRSLASAAGAFMVWGCRISFAGGAKKVRGTLLVIRGGLADAEILAVVPVE